MQPTDDFEKPVLPPAPSHGNAFDLLSTSQKRQLTRAVVDSINYMTGEPPRRRPSIVPQLLGWIGASLFVLFIIYNVTR